MSPPAVLLQILLPIFLVIGLGFSARRWLGLSPEPFSRLSLYVLSPALAYSSLSQSELQASEVLVLGFFVLALTLGLAVVGLLLSRGLGHDPATRSAFLMGALFVNAGNYGLPVNLLAFGQPGLERAMVYFVASAVVLNTLGVYLAARGQSRLAPALARVARMPLLYATLAGLAAALSGLRPPYWLEGPVGLVGQAAVPVLLLVLGMQLSGARLGPALPTVGLASALRLGGGFLVALGLAELLGLEGLTRQVALLQSSMPTAVMTTVLALEFRLRTEVVTGTVLVSTLASLFTISLLLAWLLAA